jgi:hypothetical protein
MQPTPLPLLNYPTSEQDFLVKNYDEKARCPIATHAASPGTSVASLGIAATTSGKPPATGRGRQVGVLGAVRVGVGFRRQIVMQAVGQGMGRTLDGFLLFL